MISESILLNTLSTISQIVATTLSIYLVIFVFILDYFWKKREFKRNTNKRRGWIIICIYFTINLIIALVYFFVFPSREFGYSILYILIAIIYFFIIGWIFEKSKNYFHLELGIIIYSFIYAIFSFIWGIFIIINAITAMPSSSFLEPEFIFNLITQTRLFFILLLISAIYSISFIIIHKLLISKIGDDKKE